MSGKDRKSDGHRKRKATVTPTSTNNENSQTGNETEVESPEKRVRVTVSIMPSLPSVTSYGTTTRCMSLAARRLRASCTTTFPTNLCIASSSRNNYNNQVTPSSSHIATLTVPIATGTLSNIPLFVKFNTKSTSDSIMASEVDKLMKNEKRQTFLLIDCRASVDYEQKRLLYSFNVPYNDNRVLTRFTSKKDVMKFLQHHGTNLLGFLHTPGFYNEIVIFDENSSHLTQPLNTLLGVIRKWNEGSNGTKVRFLAGGAIEFERQYPEKMSYNWKFPMALAFPATISKFENCPEVIQTRARNEEIVSAEMRNPIVDNLRTYLKNLDSAKLMTWFMMVSKRQLSSLEAIKLALLKEENDDLSKKLDSRMPEDFKCSVCFDMYSGEILQCNNGHCICNGCSKTLAFCPQCRTPYGAGGRIRNRAMERMMETTFKIDCINANHGCMEKLIYSQLSSHIHTCPKKVQNKEVNNIDKSIDLIKKEMETMHQQLKVTTQAIRERELQLDIDIIGTHPIPRVNIENLLEDIRNKNYLLNVAKSGLAEEMFVGRVSLSTIFMLS